MTSKTIHLPHALLVSSALAEPVGKVVQKFRATFALDAKNERDRGYLSSVLGAAKEVAAELEASEYYVRAITRGENVTYRGRTLPGLEGRVALLSSSFDAPSLFERDRTEATNPGEQFRDGTIVYAILAIQGSKGEDGRAAIYANLRGLMRVRFGGPLWTPPRPKASDFAQSATEKVPEAAGLDDFIGAL